MSIKNGLSKVGMILKAYLTEDPVGEKFYEDRLEICRTCEYNSDNTDKPIALEQRVAKSTLCPDKPICTACGCCIHKKAKVPTVDCGLADKGMEPKWVALVKAGQLDKDLTISNLTPEIGSVGTYGQGFVYNVGNVTEDVVKFSLALSKKNSGIKLKNLAVSCGCTVAKHTIEEDGSLVINAELSTEGFVPGQKYTKRITVAHYVTSKSVKNINIDVNLTKVKNNG